MGRVFERESRAGAPKEEQRGDGLGPAASAGWGEEAMLPCVPCGLLDLCSVWVSATRQERGR